MDSWMIDAIEAGLRGEGVEISRVRRYDDLPAAKRWMWDAVAAEACFHARRAHIYVRENCLEVYVRGDRTTKTRRSLRTPLDDPKVFEKVAAVVREVPRLKDQVATLDTPAVSPLVERGPGATYPMKPHQPSNKTAEELAAQREHRLRARIAKAYEKSGVIEQALKVTSEILADADVAKRTKARLVQSVLANGNRAAQGPGTTNIDARTGIFTAQDFLRLATTSPDTTGCGPALPTASDPMALPTPSLREEVRSPAAGLPTASEPAERPPARALSADASEATPPALRAPVPAETVGDPAPLLRCPDCHASWEEGHERACPVPKENPDTRCACGSVGQHDCPRSGGTYFS